jgi:hypothetical protein
LRWSQSLDIIAGTQDNAAGRTEIKLRLKDKKRVGKIKQPKPVSAPLLALPAPALPSPPASPKQKKSGPKNSQPGSPSSGKQTVTKFLSGSDDDDMPVLPEELPEV